jgi:hypothetical protein
MGVRIQDEGSKKKGKTVSGLTGRRPLFFRQSFSHAYLMHIFLRIIAFAVIIPYILRMRCGNAHYFNVF